jgi:D-aminopeptidase
MPSSILLTGKVGVSNHEPLTHSQCNNVIWGELHERAECILGNPPRFEGIEAYDGLILLG